jgi:hypothetical protein
MKARFELLEKRLFHGGDAAQDDPLPAPPAAGEQTPKAVVTPPPETTSPGLNRAPTAAQFVAYVFLIPLPCLSCRLQGLLIIGCCCFL